MHRPAPLRVLRHPLGFLHDHLEKDGVKIPDGVVKDELLSMCLDQGTKLLDQLGKSYLVEVEVTLNHFGVLPLRGGFDPQFLRG